MKRVSFSEDTILQEEQKTKKDVYKFDQSKGGDQDACPLIQQEDASKWLEPSSKRKEAYLEHALPHFPGSQQTQMK